MIAVTGVVQQISDARRGLDHLNLEMVLENKVAVGTVNVNRRHFEAAANDLGGILRRWPDFWEQMINSTINLPRAEARRSCGICWG